MTTPKKPPVAAKVSPNTGNSDGALLMQSGKKSDISTKDFVAAAAIRDKKLDSEDRDTLSIEAEVMSPDTTEKLLESLRDLSSYKDNILQKYDNSAYHIRLFQTPDRDVINFFMGAGKTPSSVIEYYKMLDKFQQVTIAETGASGFNIQSVQIESLVSPNFKSVALNTTSIVMSIVEPNGVAFLDALKKSALQMRVRDVTKCWYYIELTFKGYSNGLAQSNLLTADQLPNGGRWIWQVQITDIDTKLGTGGGEYKITMVPYCDTSLEAEARLTPDMMIAEGNDIGEFFDDLTKQLNESWVLKTATNNYLAYNFKFHGVKGRPTIKGEDVRAFKLVNTDNSLDYIRHIDVIANNGNPTSDDIGEATQIALANHGQRATSAQLAALARQIIPGVRVTSGQRSAAHNRAVGGKTNSQHISGTAIDIKPPAMSAKDLQAKFAQRGVLVDVINEGDHYHIQGSRTLTKAAVNTYQAERTKDKTDTVAAPSSAETLPISPLSGLPRGQFARGTSIDEIVTTVFGCCTEAQQLAKDSQENDGSPDDVIEDGSSNGRVNGNGFRESIVFRVEPEVRVLAYDPLFNRYGRSITYHIYGYVTQVPILSRTQVISANDAAVQKRMLATLVKQGLLRKKYNYVYTGQNLEIIDLDIAFNLAWAAALPMLLRNEAYTAQSLYSEEVKKDYTRSLDVLQAASQLADDVSEAQEELLAAQNSGDTDAANKAQEKLMTATAEASANNEKLSKLRQRLLDNLPKFDQRAAINGARISAEDLNSSTVPSLVDMNVMMRYANDDIKNSISGGMVGQHHNGRTIYGTVMSQLEGPMSAQMMTLAMKIHGDPYWIGPGNLEQVVRRESDNIIENSADYTIGDNALTLEFSYPLGTSDETDNVILKRSETFTGIYRVTKVVHDFSNGLFTQSLEGVRMPLIDLFKAMGAGSNT